MSERKSKMMKGVIEDLMASNKTEAFAQLPDIFRVRLNTVDKKARKIARAMLRAGGRKLTWQEMGLTRNTVLNRIPVNELPPDLNG